MKFYFEKLNDSHKDVVFAWLDEPHVKEFWDNSPEHRADILNFINHRKESSPYFDGIFTYWLGFYEGTPYSFLMTSEVLPAPDLPKAWGEALSKTGKTYSIDFMIGSQDHFGKGLAASTLETFCTFIQEEVDSEVNVFIIDPAETNPRAKHVYEKAGFKVIAEFRRDFGDKKDVNHFLMLKEMGRKENEATATN